MLGYYHSHQTGGHENSHGHSVCRVYCAKAYDRELEYGEMAKSSQLTTCQVPSATTTSIVTSIATAAVSSFAGPFLIVDPTDTTYFTLEELGIDSAYVSLQPLSDANYFSLQDGSLTVEDSSNYELYADPAYATIADDYIGGEYGPTTVFAFNTTDYQGETALSCSITQNSDQTCPLTCTGNGGSQFYYCPSAADGPEPTVLLGPANTAGKNCGSTPVLFSAFVVGPEV